MPARSRSRNTGNVSGGGTWGGSPIGYSYPTTKEQCDDVIGNFGGNNPLDLVRRVYSGSFVTKTSGTLQLQKCPSFMYTKTPGPPTMIPAVSSYLNRLLASTGPITPRVNLPLFVYELKDIPMMLRHAGDLLHKIRRPSGLDPTKEAAAATLAYQFGWAPLIGDLKKLLSFGDAVAKQQRVLRGAHSERGIRRRVSLGTDSYYSGGTDSVWSVYGLFLTPQFNSELGAKTWGVVHWKVRDPNQVGKYPSWNSAMRSALGFNLGMIPITIWKAIPWSWLVDWFTDISSVLTANYNMVYYRPFRACIMRTAWNIRRYKAVPAGPGPDDVCTEGTVESTFKSRYPVNNPSPSVTLKLPFLDSFKLSILGSLTILRISGRR